VITSPVKRCGKTTLLNLLSALVPRPLSTSNITASALFRTVEKYSPSLLIDEADSFLTDNEELRGILNSGHRKASAYVIRTTGDDYEPQMFTTWSPKIIALIGALPDTLEDRAIIIRLQRKSASEKKERLRSDRMGEFEPVCRRAARWASDLKETLRYADPDIPPEITNDRARDNWRPLLAIADAAGGDWPQFARETTRTMASEEPDSESARTLLLADLKMIFEDHIERLASDEIIRSLVEMESRSWAEWKGGKPLSKVGLAGLLRPFGIKPRKWREGKQSERGYYRSDFDETFARYLPSNSPQSPHAQESVTYNAPNSPQDTDSVATSNDTNSLKTNPVASVSSQNTPTSNKGTEPDEGNTASVAFMITKGARQQLYDLGYSRSDVDQMKPEEAQELIAAQKVKGDDREVIEI
jgi:putative DNA primase/helicase